MDDNNSGTGGTDRTDRISEISVDSGEGLTLHAGQTATTACTATGFPQNATVTLAATGVPAGVTAAFTPASFKPTAQAPAQAFSVKFTAAATLPGATAHVEIQAKVGSAIRARAFVILTIPTEFEVGAAGDPQQSGPGLKLAAFGKGTLSIALHAAAGIGANVAL